MNGRAPLSDCIKSCRDNVIRDFIRQFLYGTNKSSMVTEAFENCNQRSIPQ